MKTDRVKQNTPHQLCPRPPGSGSGGVNLTTMGMTSTEPGRNHGSSALCGELGAPSQKQTASHRCFPSLSIHPPASHLTESGRDAQQQREKRLLAVDPGLAGFSRTAVSNKVSRLKNKWSTSQQSSRRDQQEKLK